MTSLFICLNWKEQEAERGKLVDGWMDDCGELGSEKSWIKGW